MTQLLNKLNNYQYNYDEINNIIDYLNTHTLPDTILNLPHKTKINKIRSFIKKANYFTVQDNSLYYREDEYDLKVVPREEINVLLDHLYKNDTNYIGIGIMKFYDKLSNHYLGITQKDVKNFLINEPIYHMSKPLRHHINKPILSSRPNERWAIDLIDLSKYSSKNRQYKYILSCIDYFSKKCWLRGLKVKTAEAVTNQMQNIIDSAGTRPDILQKDNGTEFQGQLNNWMQLNNIQSINTLSYSPQSNGLIENLNKNVRKIIRETFIRNNNTNWIDHLNEIEENKNTQTNNTTRFEPNEIWTQDGTINNKAVNVENKIKAKAERMLQNTTELNIGDYVRVNLSALQSSIRKMIKDGQKKDIIVKWSPEIYIIDNKLNKDNAHQYENYRYTLRLLDGTKLTTEINNNRPNVVRRPKRFFASDLLKVNGAIIQNNTITIRDANKLNAQNQQVIRQHQERERIIHNQAIPIIPPVAQPILHRVVYDRPEVQPRVFERRNRGQNNQLNNYVR